MHFPTDISLLKDACRKTTEIAGTLASELGDALWRQQEYLLNKLTKRYHAVRRLKHSIASSESRRAAKASQMDDAYLDYLKHCQHILVKGQVTLSLLEKRTVKDDRQEQLGWFVQQGARQVELIIRRVFEGQVIPHHHKIFSLFEPHTEWVSKGKAGVPVELGLRVCVLQDQFGFTLHHRVMVNETDDQVAVPMAKETRDRFPAMNQVSYDKGFWSPGNLAELSTVLDRTVLPKKGRLSSTDKEREHHLEFRRARRKHSAVESDINCLEVHGLDKCRDSGLPAFKRYAALAVVGNNLQRLGKLLIDRDRDKQALLCKVA